MTRIVRNEYHPEQLTSPRRQEDQRSIEVHAKTAVLYDAREQPIRRQIGFQVKK